MVDIAFNIGGKVTKFKNLIEAAHNGNVEVMKGECLTSYKEEGKQVKILLKGREKFRIGILDKISQNNSQTKNSTRTPSPNSSSKDSDVKFSTPKGGIDLNIDRKILIKNSEKYNFCGIIFDKQQN